MFLGLTGEEYFFILMKNIFADSSAKKNYILSPP